MHCVKATSFNSPAGLAQSVERKTLNLKAAGSTPAFGYSYKPNLRFLFWSSFFFSVQILKGSEVHLRLSCRLAGWPRTTSRNSSPNMYSYGLEEAFRTGLDHKNY